MTTGTELTPIGVEQRGKDAKHTRKPALFDGEKGIGLVVAIYGIATVPTMLLLAGLYLTLAYPNFLDGYLSLDWRTFGVAIVLYFIRGWGVTVGFHRYLTHGAFHAKRGLKIALAMAGQLAIQGPVLQWVGDHRRHHAFSDKPGDPHSPHVTMNRERRKYTGDPNDPRIGTDGFNWVRNSKGKIIFDTGDPDSPVRYGSGFLGTSKGLLHAHMGWFGDRDKTNIARFAPKLQADPDLVAIDKYFWAFIPMSLVVVPGLPDWALHAGSLKGLTAGIFWAGLIGMAVLHHVTWSVNSICHMIGERPFKTTDKSSNFWPLAILSFGESWHNLHHADPTCARHGVLKGQLDSSARVIWLFEKFGWASKVKWPTPQRKARLLVEQNTVPVLKTSWLGRLGQRLTFSYWRSLELDRELKRLLDAGVIPESVQEQADPPSDALVPQTDASIAH